MLKDTSELKEFISWAKDKALIKAFKIGEIEVTFSDLAFVDAINQIPPEANKVESEERNTSKTLVDTLNTDEEDEELLTWSSRP